MMIAALRLYMHAFRPLSRLATTKRMESRRCLLPCANIE
jgi:hypothetical protein